MAVHTTILNAPIGELLLDPSNPRLGRQNVQKKLSQDKILEVMQGFALEELGISVLQSGFWPQEAVIAFKEKVGKLEKLVVIEGNRRLAALKLLQFGVDGKAPDDWNAMYAEHSTKEKNAFKELLKKVPYILADKREDVQEYLGFRHVTGIKQWEPAEKAEYIAKLIDQGMSYKEVTDAIGSKVDSVRKNYISFRILLQMEEQSEIHVPSVEERFSVLTLSLRTDGVQSYLGVDMTVDDPKKAQKPVPANKLKHLVRFATWLFGNSEKEIEPIIKDSRQVDQFGKVLENEKAVQYLEKTTSPKFPAAYRIAGGDAADVAENIEQACFQLEEALGVIHHVKNTARVKEAATRLVKDVAQLLGTYPDLKTIVCGGEPK